MMLKIPLYVFLVTVTLSVVYGAVSFDPIMTERVYGKTVRYCSYKGLKMLPRSKIKNYDTCEKCKCTRRGLSCATLSFRNEETTKNALANSVDPDEMPHEMRCRMMRRLIRVYTVCLKEFLLSTAFTVNYPDDSKCISVRIGCRNRWVKRNNNNRRCPRRHIPKDISMVGK